jgi:tetratricopeptide (TPR) repeat protein
LLPAVLGGLVYLNALHNPFVYDDAFTVLRNPSLRDLSNWRFLLVFNRFRPLVNLSYAFDVAFWGAQPFGFHVTGLLLHLTTVVLLFFWTRDLVADEQARANPTAQDAPRSLLAPFTTAMLFAVHPLLTEAVVYTSARSELLCAVFSLGALLLARRAVAGRRLAWLPAALCWLLAIASKESAVAVPLVFLAWDRLLGPGEPPERRRRLLRLHLPLLTLVLAGGMARVALFLRQEAHGQLPREVWQNACTELTILWRYLRLLVMPVQQSVFHPAHRVASALEAKVLLAAAAIAAVALLGWLLRRRLPVVVLGLLWFPLFLAPSSVIPLFELMAEHRIYVASAGIFLAAGALLARLTLWWRAQGFAPRLVEVLLVVLVATLCLLTLRRNEIWSDPVMLWDDAARKAPLTWAPHYALAEALRARGDCSDALPVYRRAIQLMPADSRARVNLAGCLVQLDRPEEARVELEATLAVDPRSAEVHNDLGMLAMRAHQPLEAMRHFQQAAQLDPRNVESRMNLAAMYERGLHRPDAALKLCEEVERIQPGLEAARECMARNRGAAKAGRP